MKKLLLIHAILLLFFINGYSQINLVKDIVSGTSGSSPDMLTDVNGTLFFYPSLINAATFPELWKTDGTEAGTTLVKVFNDYSGGINYNFSFNGSLYIFRAGGILTKSDGTTSGTVLIKTFFSYSTSVVIFQNNFYFVASSAAGDGLYKSDGTAAGTVFISDKPANQLVVSGSYIYFEGNDAANGNELWRTDGTTAGTVLVKNINTTVVNAGNSNPHQLTDVNGTLFFLANDGINGNELWKSDGTEIGTVLVKNIVAGSGGISTNLLTNVNGVLYFTTNYNDVIWKSDGTATGTVLVKQNLNAVGNLTNVNGTLFFSAEDPFTSFGLELWKTDGTLAGTVRVKDVRTGYGSSGILECKAVGSTLYFSAINDTYGRELWKSDGTEAGTTLVQDRNSGTTWFTPKKLTVSGSKLFIVGTTATEGMELFVYDTNTLSINKNTMTNNFKIYPNPTSGILNIEVDESLMGAKAAIYNLLGQKVKDFDLKSTTTNQFLNNGIYLLEIEKEGVKTTKKLIVN